MAPLVSVLIPAFTGARGHIRLITKPFDYRAEVNMFR